MTWEERRYCRECAIAELRSTGREDVEAIIASLESNGFFTAGCKGHDEAEGGAVSHALWTLHFARELARRAAEGMPGSEGLPDAEAIQDEDLIMAALVHGTSAEAAAMAIAYSDCIPFGTKPIDVAEPDVVDEWIDTVLDNDDHRLWTGGDDEFYDTFENSSAFPCHLVMTLTVRGEDEECDVAILSDDSGDGQEGADGRVGSNYTLMLLSSEEGEDALFRSDRRVFVYTDMVFYITRFPQYRSSYVALRNAKGKWGLVALRDDRKMRSGHLIADEKVADFTYRSPGKAAHAIRSRSGNEIGITHPDFYVKIPISRYL